MVRFLARDVVKFGHWEEYRTACRAWREAGTLAGLPPFRFSASNWGTMQEVFFEADFDDAGDVDRRFAAAANSPDFAAALIAVESHIADGQSFGYLLREMALE
ncbi:MAG: hypothetical protein ACHQ15_08125 [Candidatus Limnocylindrales bacterium]